MASPQHPTTIENLPCEVLSEISVRLLAKEVAQMRSVCKSWNALLSESSFVKSHLNRSIQNNDEILLFCGLLFSFNFGPNPFTARLSRSPNLELTDFIKPPVFPIREHGCGVVVGSVNGLICFFYYSSPDLLVHIWNPSLSALLTLPPSSLPSDEFSFGFGFDPKTDEYKVVKLTTISGSRSTNAEVYSMRKGTWESISQSFPSHITIPGVRICQICVDDRLHWLCQSDLESKQQTIVGFDLGEEAFIQIPLPETILDLKVYEWFNYLGVLGGKLCVISRIRDGKFEVWVMNEYGLAKSWVKHHVFSQLTGDIIPYGFTSQGEFLFQAGVNDNHFGLYDTVGAKTKTFMVVSNCLYSKVVEYVDSLVWVPTPKHEISSCDIAQLQIG